MHLRRALLLFAIVLGLAAVAASVSRTERSRPAPSTPSPAGTTETAAPGTGPRPAPDPGTKPVRFEQGGSREVREIRTGQAATVVVDVDSAGQAELEGLGDTRPAEPPTPASFDVFQSKPGNFPVLFHPAAGGHTERIGTLHVVSGR